MFGPLSPTSGHRRSTSTTRPPTTRRSKSTSRPATITPSPMRHRPVSRRSTTGTSTPTCPRASPSITIGSSSPTSSTTSASASVSGEVAWSPDNFDETGDAVAFTGGVAVPVLDNFAFFDGGLEVSANVGHQSIEDDVAVDDSWTTSSGTSARRHRGASLPSTCAMSTPISTSSNAAPPTFAKAASFFR